MKPQAPVSLEYAGPQPGQLTEWRKWQRILLLIVCVVVLFTLCVGGIFMIGMLVELVR